MSGPGRLHLLSRLLRNGGATRVCCAVGLHLQTESIRVTRMESAAGRVFAFAIGE